MRFQGRQTTWKNMINIYIYMYRLNHYIIHYHHHHHHHDAVSPGFYSGDDFPQRDLRFFFRTRVRGRTFPHLFTASKENPQDSVEFAEPNIGFHVNLPLFINPFWDCVMMGGVLGTKTRHPGKGIRWDGLRQNWVSNFNCSSVTKSKHPPEPWQKVGDKQSCPFLGPWNGGWDY